MIYNDHSRLVGKHAFMSPSGPSWLNYDELKLQERYLNRSATDIGTIAHGLAQDLIKERVQLDISDSKILDLELRRNGIKRQCYDIDFLYPNFMNYVNDAISYELDPEVVLYFSENCFGTTDSIRFDSNFLRIHDYKSGTTPAHPEQLLIYAALFCLEYKQQLKLNINKMRFELRLYQYDILTFNPTPEEVKKVMAKIIENDKILQKLS